MHAHFAGDMGEQFVPVVEFDSEHGVGQAFYDRALHEYCVFFGSDDADFRVLVGMMRWEMQCIFPDARQQEANARKQLSYSPLSPIPTPACAIGPARAASTRPNTSSSVPSPSTSTSFPWVRNHSITGTVSC